MKSLLKGSMIYGLGQVLNKMISFFLLPFFTTYLTTKDFGITAVISIYTLIITSIFSLGTGSVIGLIYYKSENQKHRFDVINTSTLFLICTSILALLLTLIGINPINKILFQHESFPLLLILSTITALLYVMVSPVTLWMQFEQKATPYVILNTSMVLTGIILNIVSVMVLKQGVFGYITSSLITSCINFIVFTSYYISKSKTITFQKELLIELVKKGWPLTFSFFFLFVIQNNSKYFLQLFTNLDLVGVYSIGFNFGTIISLIVNSFNTAYFPYIMSFMNKTEEAPSSISKVLQLYLLAFCVLITGVFIAAKPLVLMMVAPSFAEAYTIVGFISLGWLFSGLFILIQPGLYYISKVYYISYVQFFAAAVSIITSIWLIPIFGLKASAITFAFGNFCMVFFMHLLNRKLNLSRYYNQISPKIIWNLLISICSIIIYVYLISQLSFPLLNSIISFIVYFIIMVLFNKAEFYSLIYKIFNKNSIDQTA